MEIFDPIHGSIDICSNANRIDKNFKDYVI